MPFPDPLVVPLKPSARYAAVLLAVTLAAAAVPWWIGMAPLLAAAGSAVLLGWGGWLVGHEALRRGNRAWAALRLGTTGRGTLDRRAGDAVSVELAGAPMANGWLVVLHFASPESGARSLVVWRDACDETTFRRLRVVALWGARKGQS